MIIIAGYPLTAAADQDVTVAAFQPMAERARRTGGCIDRHDSADPLELAFREIHVDRFRTERACSPS